ncbi:MAG: hypothetical protein LBN95_06515 [Prevotellaceae bacterium]|jgi:hypothetical protein|nr:hypothetical protein [Prevotellaceae bacterium]
MNLEKKLDFPQKNNFVVKHKNKNYFSKDLELFKKHFPIHALNNPLNRANEFTREGLDGQMISILLEKVSPEEILQNRGIEIQKPKQDDFTLIELAKEKLTAVGIDIAELSDEVLKEFANIDTSDFEKAVQNFKAKLQSAEIIESVEQLKKLCAEKQINIENKTDEDLEKFVGQEIETVLAELVPALSEEEIKAKEDAEKQAIKEAELERLKTRIDTIEESTEINENEIADLRSELEDKDADFEKLMAAVEELEKKAFNKKKAKSKNSKK